jgi:hypothetical protein
MIASTSVNRPPAPMPWNARNAASWYIEFANEHSAEPTMNTVIANMNSFLRPYRSPSLP